MNKKQILLGFIVGGFIALGIAMFLRDILHIKYYLELATINLVVIIAIAYGILCDVLGTREVIIRIKHMNRKMQVLTGIIIFMVLLYMIFVVSSFGTW